MRLLGSVDIVLGSLLGGTEAAAAADEGTVCGGYATGGGSALGVEAGATTADFRGGGGRGDTWGAAGAVEYVGTGGRAGISSLGWIIPMSRELVRDFISAFSSWMPPS